MELKRTKGARRTAGATHTSCKARPLVPLRLCTAPGPQEPPSPPTRDRDGKGGSPGTFSLGRRGENQNRVQIGFAQGPACRKAASEQKRQHLKKPLARQHQSHWEEEGRGGLAWGTEETRDEGGSRGGGEQAAAGLSHRAPPSSRAGGYLSSAGSGMPASVRAACSCIRTPRMLLMKPLESGKRGKPMSG